MKVQVRYFASLREALGAAETVDIAPGSTLAMLREQLIGSSPQHAEVLARGRTVRCALNLVMSDESALLGDAAEVGFFPPVTGG